MLKIVKRMMSVVLIGVLAAAMAGCGGSSTEEKKDTSKEKAQKVIIGTQEMPNDEGIAKAKDYFSKEMGIKVEIKQFDSGKDVVTALASNSIDFGLLGSCPASLAISQGTEVKCIWIHEVLGSIESLALQKNEGMKSVKDLKGKTIATPFASTAHFSLLHTLEKAGLSESDVKLLDMQPSEIYAAWKNKQIDAAYVWEPTLSELENSQIISTSSDMADAGYMTSNMELVSTKFAKENPDLTTAYIKAVAKAVDLYQKDEDSAVEIIAEALKLKKQDAKGQMSGSIWLSAKEQLDKKYFGTTDKKGSLVQNLYDTAVFLKNQGSITEVPNKSVFEKAVDPSYIESALK